MIYPQHTWFCELASLVTKALSNNQSSFLGMIQTLLNRPEASKYGYYISSLMIEAFIQNQLSLAIKGPLLVTLGDMCCVPELIAVIDALGEKRSPCKGVLSTFHSNAWFTGMRKVSTFLPTLFIRFRHDAHKSWRIGTHKSADEPRNRRNS